MYFIHVLSVCIIILSNVLAIVFVPLLFAKYYRTTQWAVDMVKVYNLTYVAGSVLYSLGWAYDLVREYHSLGGTFGEHLVIKRMFGPYWYVFWISVINLSLLPLLLALKNFRGSLIIAPCITLSNFLLSRIAPYGNRFFKFNDMDVFYFFIALTVYAIAYAAAFTLYKNAWRLKSL
ncbi:MAG: hypothetical protein M0D57_09955 [Sphingobacteriales bacterium JAD_PAG50586_3]|nr:MAG: hypothetical protein M0D57_09955 [Sphingobacteriales bacterium JAD_PAG50586_3]